MRAQEFITEREDWMHMDTPTIDRWREEMRVGKITSGPESTFQSLAPPNKQPKSLSVPAIRPSEERVNQDLYKGAARDEYWAQAPRKWGGRATGPDQSGMDQQEKYDAKIGNEYMKSKKNSDWYDPEDLKKQKLWPANLPGGTKEKKRT